MTDSPTSENAQVPTLVKVIVCNAIRQIVTSHNFSQTTTIDQIRSTLEYITKIPAIAQIISIDDQTYATYTISHNDLPIELQPKSVISIHTKIFNYEYECISLLKTLKETMANVHSTIVSNANKNELFPETLLHMIVIYVFGDNRTPFTIAYKRSSGMPGNITHTCTKIEVLPMETGAEILQKLSLHPTTYLINEYNYQKLHPSLALSVQSKFHKYEKEINVIQISRYSNCSSSLNLPLNEWNEELREKMIANEKSIIDERLPIIDNDENKAHLMMNTDPCFQIFVKTLNGKSITIMVNDTHTVADIKILIQAKIDAPPEVQRLIFAGKRLENGRSMGDYGIHSGNTLHLVMRLLGGILCMYDMSQGMDIQLNDKLLISDIYNQQLVNLRLKCSEFKKLLVNEKRNVKYFTDICFKPLVNPLKNIWIANMNGFESFSNLIIDKCEKYSNVTHIAWIDFSIFELELYDIINEWFVSCIQPFILSIDNKSNIDDNKSIFNITGFVLREESEDVQTNDDNVFRYHHKNIGLSDNGCVQGLHVDDCQWTVDICLGGTFADYHGNDGGCIQFYDSEQKNMFASVEHEVGKILLFPGEKTLHAVKSILHGYRVNLVLFCNRN